VYIAPHEALAKDMAAAWNTKFGDGLGVSVVLLTGESAADLKLLERGNLVVSSPAHWDALSRRCGGEGHLLGGAGRRDGHGGERSACALPLTPSSLSGCAACVPARLALSSPSASQLVAAQ
jgi:hypothetical protein